MNYRETVEYLMGALPMYQRQGAPAYKPNLDNSKALDLYDGSPHTEYTTVHIAGTNGKGSVSHTTAAILAAAGYKTGLFTSPHLIDFRERIRVNGEKIDEDFIVRYVAERRDIFDEIQPSFFEMSAALAFAYFADQGVDIAIIEVGMGGRLDSTNIIQPAVTAITSIGFDHMAFLGNTLQAIASEKAGIVKKDTPLVLGQLPDEARKVCIAKARSLDAPFQVASEVWELSEQYIETETQHLTFLNRITREPLSLDIDLLGRVQAINLPVALCVVEYLRKLGFTISSEALKSGVRNVAASTHLMGRWQIVRRDPLVVCDTGHNEEGLRAVVEQISLTPKEKLHIVLGFVSDKEVSLLLGLLPKDATYYCCAANVPRALAVDKLLDMALVAKLNATAFPSVDEAISAALAATSPTDMLFIGGSTFVVAEALARKW